MYILTIGSKTGIKNTGIFFTQEDAKDQMQKCIAKKIFHHADIKSQKLLYNKTETEIVSWGVENLDNLHICDNTIIFQPDGEFYILQLMETNGIFQATQCEKYAVVVAVENKFSVYYSSDKESAVGNMSNMVYELCKEYTEQEMVLIGTIDREKGAAFVTVENNIDYFFTVVELK